MPGVPGISERFPYFSLESPTMTDTFTIDACEEAFVRDFCPYKGSPDPLVVWRAAWQSARAHALKEAAEECENEELGFRDSADGASDGRYDWKADGAGDCAAAIRELAKMD